MKKQLSRIASVILMLACPVPLAIAAQPVASPQIDGAGRPAKIPVAAFAQGLRLEGARLSQNGKRLAVAEDVDGKAFIRIYDASTLDLQRTIEASKSENFNWVRWAGDDRLLISVMREEENALFWARTSRMLVLDMSTSELGYVGLKHQGLDGDNVLFIDPAGQYVLVSISSKGRVPPDVYRISLDGKGSETALRVVKHDGDIEAWWADTAGVVRLGMGRSRRGSLIVLYRHGPEDEFQRVTKVSPDDEDTLDRWDALGLYPGSDTGYTVTAADNGRRLLREFNYRTGTPGKVLFEDASWDVKSVTMDSHGRPKAVGIVDDVDHQVWLDPTMQDLQKNFSQALGGKNVKILANADGKRMLVLQSAADDPGALYVFTPSDNRLAFFANLRPEIDHRLLSKGTAHDIRTRDGLTMRSYLTLPRGRGKTGLPLIIMPHGGPFGIRDTLDYDDWVQLLANRGYAVLQPNYRGSGGFGAAFEEAGDGQIGRRMQDDMDDAVAWAIAQGYADASRVCVLGASYGGYAAQWAVIRNPETYRCAVSWAGVSDWDAMLLHDSKAMGQTDYRDEWKPKILGNDRGFDLSGVSPITQIDRLTRPLLLAHGKKDRRVPYSQHYRLVDKAGKRRDLIETLVLDEGHSPVHEENHEKLLNAMVAFLEKHNPSD